jgi:hypothetical protein
MKHFLAEQHRQAVRLKRGGANGDSGAQSCDETIGCPETRRPLPGTIQDQELLLDENGLGDYGTDATRTQESGKRNDDVDEKDDQIAHLSIAARTANAGNWSENQQFARGKIGVRGPADRVGRPERGGF